jgi:hypothetical protein
MSSHFLIHHLPENGATVSKQWSDRWCESDPTIFTRSPTTIVERMRVALLPGSLWIGRRTMNMHSPVGAAKPGFGEIWGDEPPFFMGMSWGTWGKWGLQTVWSRFWAIMGYPMVLWMFYESCWRLWCSQTGQVSTHWLRQDTPNAELTYSLGLDLSRGEAPNADVKSCWMSIKMKCLSGVMIPHLMSFVNAQFVNLVFSMLIPNFCWFQPYPLFLSSPIGT